MIMIIIISAFNVISSIVMLVIEKENDIKTLKFLGMTKPVKIAVIQIAMQKKKEFQLMNIAINSLK